MTGPHKKKRLGHRYCEIVIYNKHIYLVSSLFSETELSKPLELPIMIAVKVSRGANHVIRELETIPALTPGKGERVETESRH